MKYKLLSHSFTLLTALAALTCSVSPAQAQDKKPNILFIMGDDIGWMQPSCYHRGLMVGETPNIAPTAKEGSMFRHYYAESSCTAGRTAFFTGMHPYRAGMVLPQWPGAISYLRPGTPALAAFLYNLGYSTGEFGKNHLGDHPDSLPTAHGFQEFWGYLYHLDAMQQVSFPDINKSPTEQTVGPPCATIPIPGVPNPPSGVDPNTGTCMRSPRPGLWMKSPDGPAGKLSTWESGMRAPCVIRWPGVIKPGTIFKEMFSSLDWVPTFVEIAGGPKGDELNKQIMAGKYKGIVKTKLDGFNQIDYVTGKSEKSNREYFFYYQGRQPSAVRYKNWKFYYTMMGSTSLAALNPATTFHWTQLQNIMRDPFENNVGDEQKGALAAGGALAAPSTAYLYDWNLLPIGQLLWTKELMSYIDFPPLQLAASYNLEQVLDTVREMSKDHPSQ